MKSLRDVYEEIGVSRTTLQGWLYDILEWPKQEREDNTALKISDEDLALIWQIRFYKQLKYSNSKIKEILRNPSFDLSQSLELQIDELTRQKEELENLIHIATMMKETGLSPSTLRFGMEDLDGVKYKDIVSILRIMSDNVFDDEDAAYSKWENISEEEINLMMEAFDQIMQLHKRVLPISLPIVQARIQALHRAASVITTESVVVLSWFLLFFSPEGVIGRGIDGEYGEGSASFFYHALQYYCKENQDNEFDRDFHTAWSNIEMLAYNHYATNSKAVQSEIKKLHAFFLKIEGILNQPALPTLKNMGKLFGQKEFRDNFDDGKEKGVAWFISRSIEIYCHKLEESEGE